ncbi:DNA polymerase III PolC-type [compost metagenome]
MIFLDLETTGLFPTENRITQIAAIKEGGQPETFVTYVNPGVEIPENIVELIGITNEMVENAPSEKEALQQLIDFMGDDYIIIAQNAPFDLGFLYHALLRNGLKLIVPNFYCTRAMSAILFPNLSHKLVDITQLFDLGVERPHDAFYDADSTRLLFHKLFNISILMGIDFKNKLIEHPDRPMLYVPENAKIIKQKYNPKK